MRATIADPRLFYCASGTAAGPEKRTVQEWFHPGGVAAGEPAEGEGYQGGRYSLIFAGWNGKKRHRCVVTAEGATEDGLPSANVAIGSRLPPERSQVRLAEERSAWRKILAAFLSAILPRY